MGYTINRLMEGGARMNKQKYMISSLTMIFMLSLVTIVQGIRINGLEFLEQSSAVNDYSFLIMIFLVILLISFVGYFVPMILIFEWQFKINLFYAPVAHKSNGSFKVVIMHYPISRKYLRLNVIRC